VPTPEVPEVPEVSTYVPAHPTTVISGVPSYPTSNGTIPGAPAPYPTGTGAPGVPTTGPATPTPTEFPGAAGKAGLSLLAVAGALVAYL
jgi:hypothetical protein